MREKGKKTLIIGIFGLWFFLVQGIGLVEAKDPDYPTKPITFYIHFSAGGTMDSVIRPLLEATGKYLGQPFIPVNKPGSGGILAAMAVMNAKPDGLTLGSCTGSNAYIMPHMEECPYKDLSGFTFIMNFTRYILPVIVRGDSPHKTWKEFIEWARKNPRAAKVGSSGDRSQSVPAMALWEAEQKGKVEFTIIPFKGSAESFNALLGGHITMDATSLTPPLIQYIKEGKVRILAYLDRDKIPGYEDIPSFYDLYGIKVHSPYAVWGPKNLPNYVLEKLDDAFAKGVKDPSFIDVMNRMYMPIVYMNRAELNVDVRESFTKVGELMKKLRAEEAKEKK
jgi:tripartite-type tricarboxylate transporter receptor subunit TctC